MKFGVNLTGPRDLPVIRALIASNLIDYVEILLDGFWYWDPFALKAWLGDVSVAFHVMHTDVLERDPASMAIVADKIKRFRDALRPLYISDHLARFSHEGRPFALLQEPFFTDGADRLLERARSYQRSVGSEILFENFPTTQPIGQNQVAFFNEAQSVGVGLLLDLSNAVVSERNGGQLSSDWLDLATHTKHFHIGGFRPSQDDPSLIIDSHDCAISPDAFGLLARLPGQLPGATERTITVEWDQDISFTNFATDMVQLRSVSE